MAEGIDPERIPLDPMGEGGDHDGDGEDYHHHDRDEETEFGEHGAHNNDGFDPDDYHSEKERTRAIEARSKLQSIGLNTPKDLRYGIIDDQPCVTDSFNPLEYRSWYKVRKVGDGYILDPIKEDEGPASEKEYKLLGLGRDGNLVKDPLTLREKNRDEAWDKIISKFPKFNPRDSPFTAKLNDYGEVIVKLNRSGGKDYSLFGADGELNKKLPKKIKNSLGKPAEKVIEDNELDMKEIKKKNKNLEEQKINASEPERKRIDEEIERNNTRYNEIEQENEVTRERTSLKNRVKEFFKKGVTITAILGAAGAVIYGIVSYFKSKLENMSKDVSNKLNDLGNKLKEILPGMIGAIVSFLFKAAGEAIGFLAKHTWLLILLVVTFLTEQIKK